MNMCPKMIEDRGPWIATHSGAKFYINEMNLCDIPIEDIAHALSMNCRYNGHIDTHYSVAEHSLAIMRCLRAQGAPLEVQRQALFHDVSEAFVPDIPRPFKGCIEGFQEYENALLLEASIEYDFWYPFNEIVKHYDRHIVRSEATRLFPNPPEWVEDFELLRICEQYFDQQGIGVTADCAKREWLVEYERIRSLPDVV